MIHTTKTVFDSEKLRVRQTENVRNRGWEKDIVGERIENKH